MTDRYCLLFFYAGLSNNVISDRPVYSFESNVLYPKAESDKEIYQSIPLIASPSPNSWQSGYELESRESEIAGKVDDVQDPSLFVSPDYKIYYGKQTCIIHP